MVDGLLRQPGGFEGFGALSKHPACCSLAVREPVDLPDVKLGFMPLPLPRPLMVKPMKSRSSLASRISST
jgi:hypothetical protein